MKLYIKSSVQIQPLLSADRCKSITLEEGRYFSNIEYRNLPSDVQDKLTDYQREAIKQHKVYVIYIQSNFYEIDASYVIPDKSQQYFK